MSICPVRLAEVKAQFELINQVTREHEEPCVGDSAEDLRERAAREMQFAVAKAKETGDNRLVVG